MGVSWVCLPVGCLFNTKQMKTGPTINRGGSKQDYSTPADFITAVSHRFGCPAFDLAASVDNKKAPGWFSKQDNSLIQEWHKIGGLLWLNPPFNNISPWAKKCDDESRLGARILLLTPASVGSNWFCNHVHRKALVLGLNGRICFDGKNGFPKDCILSCYGFGVGFDTWRWK